MDVTEEILRNTQIYGASDYTAPHSLTSAKALNYAEGASIQKPINELVTILPRRLKYQDTVGLFGAENRFIKINLNIQDTGNVSIEEPGWSGLRIVQEDPDLLNTYYTAFANQFGHDSDVNYDEAIITNNILADTLNNPLVGVSIDNLKTGNKYIDAWFDVRLYTKARQEHPYDLMYLPFNDYFYIGFHARNTKRLPYNVECLIGTDIKPKNAVDPKFLAKIN